MQQTTLKFFNEQSADNSGLSVYTPLSLIQRDNIKLRGLPGLRTDENYSDGHRQLQGTSHYYYLLFSTKTHITIIHFKLFITYDDL